MSDLSLEYLRTKYYISLVKRPRKPPQTGFIFYVQLRDKRTKSVRGTRSTGESRESKAREKLLELAREIHQQTADDRPEDVTWDEFVERYKKQVMATQRFKTVETMQSIIRKIEQDIRPKSPKCLRPHKISQFTAKMREKGLTEFSIKRNLSGLRKLLNWAHKMEYIDSVPYIPFPDPKDLVRKKGRFLVTEEYERMLEKVKDVVGADREPEWRRILTGLWLSGLRIGEFFRLDWTDGDFVVDFSSDKPRFKILPEGEKGKRYRRHPMTPDFFAFLMQTPPELRHGPVFWPSAQIATRRYTTHTAGKKIAKIGELAIVRAGTGLLGSPHFASAQDFRRSFGERWRKKVRPETLQRLMRHTDLKVTLKFYADGVDDDLAEDIWEHAKTEESSLLDELSANNRANNETESHKQNQKDPEN